MTFNEINEIKQSIKEGLEETLNYIKENLNAIKNGTDSLLFIENNTIYRTIDQGEFVTFDNEISPESLIKIKDGINSLVSLMDDFDIER